MLLSNVGMKSYWYLGAVLGGGVYTGGQALSFSFHKPTSFQGLGVTTYKGKLNHRVSYTIFSVTCQ